MKQLRLCSYEVQADGKVYVRNRTHLGKYKPRDDVGPAVEPLEVTEEVPITMDKEESIKFSPENHQGKGEPEPDNGETETLSTHNNREYRTRSTRVSVKPARFNYFVMDLILNHRSLKTVPVIPFDFLNFFSLLFFFLLLKAKCYNRGLFAVTRDVI